MIVDEEMRPLSVDGVTQGEIIVRSPWLTQSYHGDPKASDALWRGGWLHTQDVATIDPTGVIRIRDRLKDVIKSGGEWVCSLSLEEVIARHPDVAEVAVFGIPDPRWQERPAAAIVPRTPGRAPDKEAINTLIRKSISDGSLSPYAMVRHVVILDQLAKTSVGKIDKKALRARFSSETVEGPDERDGCFDVSTLIVGKEKRQCPKP